MKKILVVALLLAGCSHHKKIVPTETDSYTPMPDVPLSGKGLVITDKDDQYINIIYSDNRAASYALCKDQTQNVLGDGYGVNIEFSYSSKDGCFTIVREYQAPEMEKHEQNE